MIGNGSTLLVSDNSGARLVQCIEQTGRNWTIGDIITVAVKKAGKGKVAAGTVSFSNYFTTYLQAADHLPMSGTVASLSNLFSLTFADTTVILDGACRFRRLS